MHKVEIQVIKPVFLQVSVIPCAASRRWPSWVSKRLHGWITMVEIIPRTRFVRIVHGLVVIKPVMGVTIPSWWHVVVWVWEVSIHWLEKKKNRKSDQHWLSKNSGLETFLSCNILQVSSIYRGLSLVVQRVGNTIHLRNLYPVDNAVRSTNIT